MFRSTCVSLDELTATISFYVHFCEGSAIPRKFVINFANNKPWITTSVENTINLCNIRFKKGDLTQYHIFKKQVRKELKLSRVNYKERVEDTFKSNNSRLACEKVKSMMGMPTNSHYS